MELTIREALVDDAEAVVAIFNPIIEAGLYTVFNTPFTVKAEAEYIENLSSRSIFQLAVEQNTQRIVGFQSMDPFASYTRAFDHVGVIGTFIDLNQRRQGIATALFQATFTAAKEKGYEKLFTYIHSDNLAALGTYLKHGFRVIGTAQNLAKIHDAYIDEFIVERIL